LRIPNRIAEPCAFRDGRKIRGIGGILHTSADNGWLRLAGALGLTSASRRCSIEQGCLGGDDGRCVPSRACPAVAYACADDAVEVAWVGHGAPRTAGPKAALAAGDLVLSSSRVRAVFDAMDAPHALAPSGGTLLDPTLALRCSWFGGLRAELAARFPLFGADRTEAALALNVGGMFGL
jgi:hypothetical protein